jgi:hypothetical protein
MSSGTETATAPFQILLLVDHVLPPVVVTGQRIDGVPEMLA